MLQGQTLRADLFDEYGRERLLKKGTTLTREVLAEVPFDALVRARRSRPTIRGSRSDLREIEERTERAGRGHPAASSRRRRRRSAAATNCRRA